VSIQKLPVGWIRVPDRETSPPEVGGKGLPPEGPARKICLGNVQRRCTIEILHSFHPKLKQFLSIFLKEIRFMVQEKFLTVFLV